MTQTQEQMMKISEFRTIFPALDETGQEKALGILRALDFAQSVMLSSEHSRQHPMRPTV